MKIPYGLQQVFEAFHIGLLILWQKPYQWIVFGCGLGLYLLTLVERRANEIGIESHSMMPTSVTMFLYSMAKIALMLLMIRIILSGLDQKLVSNKTTTHLDNQPTDSPTDFFKIIVYFIKGFILSQLIVLIPAFLFGFFKIKYPTHPYAPTGIFAFFFIVSMTFLGFSCWILIDQCASLKKCIIDSYKCGKKNLCSLFVFYAISVAIMVACDKLTGLEAFSYVIYFPISLAAQGYLYRKLCAPQVSTKSWFNIPFLRPPIF